MPAYRSMKTLLAMIGLSILPLTAVDAAAGDPTGVWMNDTGRGAIEIKPCGAALCGHVVWVKDTSDTKGCGRQIIGNAAKVNSATWDNGWIYSPEKKKKYDVELKPLTNGTLQVTGYAGSKIFSKTMIWTRAPSNLVRCGAEETVAKADPASKTKSDAATKPDKTKTAVKTKPETKPASKAVAVPPAEPAIVPPAPKPAERPAAKPETAPPAPPLEIARAEPNATAPTSESSPDPSPAAADAKPVPQVHALPGVEDKNDAPDVAAPPEDDDGPPTKLDMGKIAKKLAQIERETGYGLKKSGNGNCRLKVPYATVNFPCKD